MPCKKFAQTKASSRLEPVLAQANSAKKARKGTAEAIYKLKLAARGSYSLTGEGLPSRPPHTGIKTTAQLSEVFSALGAKLSGQDGQRDRDTAGTMRAVPIRGTVQDYERALCCTYVELRLLAPWQLGGVCFSTDTKVVRIDLRCGSIEDGQWAAVPNASSPDFPTRLVLAQPRGEGKAAPSNKRSQYCQSSVASAENCWRTGVPSEGPPGPSARKLRCRRFQQSISRFSRLRLRQPQQAFCKC